MIKPSKNAQSKSEDAGAQDILNVRALKLEDQLEKMENIISNKEQNTVFHTKKQRNKLANANDRLSKVENKLKGIDQSIIYKETLQQMKLTRSKVRY